jgi:hypothetical protein
VKVVASILAALAIWALAAYVVDLVNGPPNGPAAGTAGSWALLALMIAGLVGIAVTLLFRARVAYVLSLALSVFLMLPIPSPVGGWVVIYVVQAVLGLIMLWLLVRNRKWFWSGASDAHP